MENNLVKVTRASVYFGEYKQARKSGYSRWAKVVLYFVHMAKDPIDGEFYALDGVESYVSLFLADAAVEDILAICEKDGQKMSDVAGYTIAGNKLPRGYRYAYTERWRLTGEWVKFDQKMIKCDPDGKPIMSKDGKRRTADEVFVSYWDGDGVELTALCRHERMRRTLAEWRELGVPTLRLEEQQPVQEQAPNEVDRAEVQS